MENKFAIYDLVAYIIPGSIMLLSVAFFYHSYIHPIPINLLESYKLYISVLFFSSSYICGQILGSFTHQIISTITRTKVIRKPDYESKLPFFSFNYQMMELQEVLVEKAQYLLDNNNI